MNSSGWRLPSVHCTSVWGEHKDKVSPFEILDSLTSTRYPAEERKGEMIAIIHFQTITHSFLQLYMMQITPSVPLVSSEQWDWSKHVVLVIIKTDNANNFLLVFVIPFISIAFWGFHQVYIFRSNDSSLLAVLLSSGVHGPTVNEERWAGDCVKVVQTLSKALTNQNAPLNLI